MRFMREILSEVRNPTGPGEMNTLLAAGDFNGDGYVDLAVSGRHGSLVWLENPGDGEPSGNWKRHFLAPAQAMECGGTAFPVRGRQGYADLVNGNDGSGDAVFWWANPGHDGPWERHLIARTGCNQIHDTAVGQVDGVTRLFFTNQKGEGGGRLWTVPIPDNPFVSPWAELELVADNLWDPNPYKPAWFPDGKQGVEGLAIGDIDGDGCNEVVCGSRWIKRSRDGQWLLHQFTEGYVTTKVQIADLDGDGQNEIILAEGDATLMGFPEGCKCAWFKPASPTRITDLWVEHRIMEGLLDAHTLKAGPITRNGQTDLLLGEIGQINRETGTYTGHLPRLWVLVNNGLGKFTPHLVDEGTGVHDCALLDLRNSGCLDIVMKPLHGPDKWNVIALYRVGSDRRK